MYCTKCGSQISDSAVFCSKCGKQLKTKVAASESAEITGQDVLQKQSKGSHKRTLGWLWDICIIVIALIALLVPERPHPVSDMKNLVFDQYGEITIGEAADRYLKDVDWEAEKMDDNEYKVMLKAFSDEVSFRFQLEFRVTYVDNMVYGVPRSVSMAGTEYTDDMSIWELMSVTYGKSLEEAKESYWEEILSD